MGLSTVPRGSEEGRAFLQERLALFGKSMTLLFLAIGVAGTVSVHFIMGDDRLAAMVFPHIVPVLAGVGAVWIVCSRGQRSPRALAALDVASTLASAAGLADALYIMAPVVPIDGPITLALTHVLFARAIIVPSDRRRTLWLSLLAALPVIALLALRAVAELGLARQLLFILGVWNLVAVGMATLTSHVLYRLRLRVEEARTLGQYTLEAKIGEGGMGVVYRARHAMLRRPTVVKLLPADRTGEADLERFEREVQHTSQLTSPHIVAIFDYGRTPDGVFYYAMEHLDGIDLEKLVAQHGPQPAARVVHILAQVCEALAEAHAAGLIHRDIKPSNIMLCRQGLVYDVAKVVDFGLVKDIGGDRDTRVTRADQVLGTPLYVSPEAVSGAETIDGRSDLYALGAVGYYLICGQHVFEGRTVVELCSHHLLSPPEPPSERVDLPVPAELEALILRCLAKKPDDRPRDAKALRDALRACAGVGRWSEEDARAAWVAARHDEPPVDPRAETRRLEVNLLGR